MTDTIDGVDLERLRTYFVEHVEAATGAPLHATLISGGRSNLTYFVGDGTQVQRPENHPQCERWPEIGVGCHKISVPDRFFDVAGVIQLTADERHVRSIRAQTVFRDLKIV